VEAQSFIPVVENRRAGHFPLEYSRMWRFNLLDNCKLGKGLNLITNKTSRLLFDLPVLIFRKIRRGIWQLSNQKIVDFGFEGRPYPSSAKKLGVYSPALTIESRGVIENRPVSHAFENRDVFELSNVNVDLKMGEVYLHSGEFVIQSTPWHPYKPSPERRRRRPKRSLEDPRGFIRLPSWTYYHQVIENLPPYLYLRRIFPEAQTLVAEDGSEISRAILDELGIPYQMHKGQVKVNRLFMVGQGRDSGYPHPVDITVLTESFSNLMADKDGSEVIYVSRLKSSRSFSNELELVELLRGTPGVKVLESESLSFLEQISLFSNARLIIGPHGAGLTNQIWMRKGGKVVELVDLDYSNPVFEILASQLGHAHQTIFLAKSDGQSLVDIETILKEMK